MTEPCSSFDPVSLGVVGLGRFGILHASTLVGLTEARLVAIVDRSEATLRLAAEQFPNATPFSDLDRAILESKVEAWVVATSTASHVPVARQLLAAGKPVLLEKPIAPNLLAAQALAPLVKPDSSNLMMGHVLLFSSEFQQLMDEVSRRGPIAFIDCVRHRPTTTLADYPGESPFHLTMVHDLYLALVLMNPAEPTAFSAQLHRTQDGACDLALAQVQWPEGGLASFGASFMTPAGMPSEGFDRMEVFGGGWVARIRPNPRPIELWDEESVWPMGLEIRADRQAPSGMLAEELRCFCRVVRSAQSVPPGATYHDAVRVLGWLHHLEQSVTLGIGKQE